MKISKQSRRDAKHLFRTCQINGLIDENRVRQMVTQVLQLKPRGFLAILEQFKRLLKLDQDRRTARVETATPLAAELQEAVRSRLTHAYGAGLNISFTQNPALIGGMRIKVGSDVYDGSVSGRLAALEASF